MCGEHLWPSGFGWGGRMREHPEALVWVEDDGDVFLCGGGDWVGASEEVDGVVAGEAAGGEESEVEVEQSGRWAGLKEGAFFAFGFAPGGVWGEAGGAHLVARVVGEQEGLEEQIGLLVGAHFFVAEEGDEAVLEMAEEALDLALGLRVWSDAVIDAQAEQSALELAARLEFWLGGGRAKKGERVGVDGVREAMALEGLAEVAEVGPSSVCGHKAGGDQAAGVVVHGEDEGLASAGRPPLVDGAVMLPEFADLRTLPAASLARLGSLVGAQELRPVPGGVAGHGSAGALEGKAGGQFIGNQSEIERAANWQEDLQKSAHHCGPGLAVVASAGSWGEEDARFGRRGLLGEPESAQFV